MDGRRLAARRRRQRASAARLKRTTLRTLRALIDGAAGEAPHTQTQAWATQDSGEWALVREYVAALEEHHAIEAAHAELLRSCSHDVQGQPAQEAQLPRDSHVG